MTRDGKRAAQQSGCGLQMTSCDACTTMVFETEGGDLRMGGAAMGAPRNAAKSRQFLLSGHQGRLRGVCHATILCTSTQPQRRCISRQVAQSVGGRCGEPDTAVSTTWR
eukprot:GGOE01008225.1.p4 GENE.GGOE01008225.1~~GGOE01008225.1.p4  ORF type:complete len:109 (-),score=1.95 GGOE01008225.1:720-1046(-)